MISLSDFWLLLAGIALFVFGMFQLEAALKELAGRTFKLFLRKHTDNKISAVFGGAIATGVLQSSSVVTFIVLGFVGAGVIRMRNALAIVFGSNLGTTFDSWIVAMLGFKFNIETISLPIIGTAGLGFILFSGKKKLLEISRFLMGFGLLFLGLSYMKGSMMDWAQHIDFSQYTHLNRFSFVVIGFIITALIQSSSATMVITLSALHSSVIPFTAAVSIVIGSELGTSLKMLFGAINGIAAKRRVAIGNIIFNVVITCLAFLFTNQLLTFISWVIDKDDALIKLVSFQTLINLCGVFLFLPFLNKFGDFLDKRFAIKEKVTTYFIEDADNLFPEAALVVLQKEIELFIFRVVLLNMEVFRINQFFLCRDEILQEKLNTIYSKELSHMEKYENVKHTEGEIISLYTRMSKEHMEKDEFSKFSLLVSATRNAMYSAKGIKDIYQDRRELRESGQDTKYEHYELIQKQLKDFYLKLIEIPYFKEDSTKFQELIKLIGQIQKDYEERTHLIYKQVPQKILSEIDIATLLNINREVHSSCKAIILAMKDYSLDSKQAENFEDIPALTIK